MSPPRLRLAFGVALLAGCPALQGPAARGDASPQIQAVRKLVAKGRVDEAIASLWQAEQALGDLDSAGARAPARDQIEATLAEIDSLARARTKTLSDVADEYGRLARAYRVARWYDAAQLQLDRAEVLAPGHNPLERRLLERRRQQDHRRASAKRETAEQDRSRRHDLLADLKVTEVGGAWKAGSDVVVSPALDNGTALMLAREPRHEDNLLRIRVQASPKGGNVGFCFGVQNIDYYLLEIIRASKSDDTWARLFRITGGINLDKLDERVFRLRAGSGWIELAVAVRGQQVSCTVDGVIRLRAKCPTTPRGGVGFFISGDSVNKDPVEYRDLRIEPLPAEGALESAATPVKPPRLTSQQKVQGRISAAESLVAKGEPEKAVLALLAVEPEIDGTIRSAIVRASLHDAVRSLLDRYDPCRAKAGVVHRAIATAYTELAQRYLDARRPFAARSLLRVAGQHDRELPAEALAEAERQLATTLATRDGLPAEPATPVYNDVMHEWFDGGREHGAPGWAWRGSYLASPACEGRDTLYVSPVVAGGQADVSVQIRLRNCCGGLVFGYRDLGEYYAVSIEHQGKDSEIRVVHVEERKTKVLAKRAVRYLPEARDSWMTCALHYEKGKLSTSFGIGPRVEVEDPALVPRGPIGLVGWTREGGGELQARNLTVETTPP